MFDVFHTSCLSGPKAQGICQESHRGAGDKSFEKRESVAELPLFCRVDTSTLSLKFISTLWPPCSHYCANIYDTSI
ncbi:hypothetical protein ABFA07_005991 [Porites harrisoni]